MDLVVAVVAQVFKKPHIEEKSEDSGKDNADSKKDHASSTGEYISLIEKNDHN